MSLRETRDAVDQHPDWPRKQEFKRLHELLIRELRKRESYASRAGKAPKSAPAAPKATEPQKQAPQSVGRALVGFFLLVGGQRLVGLAIWGSIYDEPGWWNVASAVLIIAGISGVVSAVKSRP